MSHAINPAHITLWGRERIVGREHLKVKGREDVEKKENPMKGKYTQKL